MATRRLIIFTIILMMFAAAPVWASTANSPDLPRIESSVEIDGSLDADARMTGVILLRRLLLATGW
jgi:hypothetical protein